MTNIPTKTVRVQKAKDFYNNIILPTLKTLVLPGTNGPNLTKAPAQLLLGTALQESALEYARQIGGGPGLGFYQMEPNTYKDLYNNFLKFRPALMARVNAFVEPGKVIEAEEMVTNLPYATAVARLQYFRAPEPLPAVDDVTAQARYWKNVWNTYKGKGKVSQYIANWIYYNPEEIKDAV